MVIAVAAIAIALYAACQTREYQQKEPKRQALRRLSASLYKTTPQWMGSTGDPFDALNEAWVVFADDQEVIAALKTLHPYYGRGKIDENIPRLVKAMAKASGVPVENLDAKFLVYPFTPQITETSDMEEGK
ncbi:MAG: hypothetical protein OXI24_05420 [Candidatus Poribacteria bacterium]|nr:hypothetical protein [Candidatus Poribacteria bacterium]